MIDLEKIKNNKDKLVVITWWDAWRDMNLELQKAISTPLETNYSAGWIKYANKHKVILATCQSKGNPYIDPYAIPTANIQSIQYLE